MMQQLINQLNHFNEQGFPKQLVTKSLENKLLDLSEISEYLLFKEHKYSRNLVHKDINFEVLLVCWQPGQIAPIHGHEGEKCWMRIESGSLQISNYNLISEKPLKLKKISQIDLEPGALDGPAEIHSVRNVSDKKAISLHIYTKPFAECDVFYPEEGIIDRKSLGYDSIDKIPC
jgi:predicted metal-dependent enzyme (double-stranded beta helix superfamily)